MPNILDANGLQTASIAEITTNLQTGLRSIYGSDINLDSDTPDGQMVGLIAQSTRDVLDLLEDVYNSFDPDLAVGIVLSQRIAINGIQKQAGTYTVTAITITCSQSVNLYGLDQSIEDVYTVQDNAGTQWLLVNTMLGVSAGTHTYNFRAANTGATLTIPNTITVPVTIVLGVTSVNNPTTALSIGLNEESDAVAKVRRQQSVSLSSQGYLQGLLAALKNVNGITSAFVYENNNSATNGDGVPGNSIWVIVAGTAAAADIAQAIYTKRNAGAGMYGQTPYIVTQADGSAFTVRWDTVRPRNLFISIYVSSINGTTPPNVAAIRSGLASTLSLGVNQTVDINEIATFVQKIDPNALVTSPGLTIASTQTLTLSGVPASGSFILNYNGASSAAISWNDSIATIITKVQAMTGLVLAVATGSLASQSIVFDLSAVGAGAGVQGLLYVTSSNLATSAPAPITFAWNEGYSNILSPPTKRDQLVLTAADILVYPMQIAGPSSIVHAGTATFTAAGGYQPNVFSISVNASGGSINSSTGAYTAGATPGTDTIKVVDAFGYFATTTILVT